MYCFSRKKKITTSLSKLQLCQQKGKYLEFEINRPRTSPGYCRNTSTSNKETSVRIFKHTKILQTLDTGVREEESKPWTEATKAEEVETIHWGPEREAAFQAVKGALTCAPVLGLLDYSKSFELFVRENKSVTGRVLTQKLDPHHCPVAYYSTQLDPAAAGNNSCVRAIATTA